MPGAYPPAAPSLSGDLLTIHRLLQTPLLLQRYLRTIPQQRFIADQLLTAKYRTSGGAIQYQMSESIVNSRAIRAISPGAEYPRDTPADGTAALAAVSKWGEASFLSDEKLKRSVYMGQELDRTIRKAANTIISKVDKLTTSAMASAVSATSAAVATWNNGSAALFRDLEVGAAKIEDLNQGYVADAVLMSTLKYAMLVTDSAIANMRRRETTDNPIYGGTMEVLGDFKVITTSVANLPSDDVWVFDSTLLGGMADEAEVDPGYAVMDNGIQFQTIRVASRDGWDIQCRRTTVPVIPEPGAAIKITGTGSLG